MELYIDSNIEDEFEGWDDDKTFKLDNGTEWKLSSDKYSYQYSYRPKAKIWRDAGRYYLEVDGMNEKVQVDEI
jgi:hypothetical protein